jgi:hypothetical protein
MAASLFAPQRAVEVVPMQATRWITLFSLGVLVVSWPTATAARGEEIGDVIKRLKASGMRVTEYKRPTKTEYSAGTSADPISKELAAGLEKLPSLHLVLSQDRLTKSLLAPVEKLSNIVQLSVITTEFDPEALKSIAGMPSLTILRIHPLHGIEDSDLENIAGATKLVQLSLEHNKKLTGKGLVHLKEMKNLQTLNLDDCPVTDETIAPLKDLTSLTRLHLRKCKLSDKCMETICQLPDLRHIDLRETNITNEGFQQLVPNIKRGGTIDVRGTKVDSKGVDAVKHLLGPLTVFYGRL